MASLLDEAAAAAEEEAVAGRDERTAGSDGAERGAEAALAVDGEKDECSADVLLPLAVLL